MPGTSPTVQRRRLGAALRALRDARGLTGAQAGDAVERSAAWISRIEGGRMGIRARDLRDLLDLYHVSDQARRNELLRLADEGRTRGWWSQYSGSVPEGYATLIGLESEAVRLDVYESVVVTGLLQTEGYAYHAISGGLLDLGPSDIEERVRVRMRRQEILFKANPAKLSLLFPESVLGQKVGGHEVMREQLHHIEDMANRPNIDIRILLNADLPPVTAVANFVLIYLSSAEPDSVYVEDVTGGKVEEGTAMSSYQKIFERFRARALPTTESLDRIRQAAEAFR